MFGFVYSGFGRCFLRSIIRVRPEDLGSSLSKIGGFLHVHSYAPSYNRSSRKYITSSSQLLNNVPNTAINSIPAMSSLSCALYRIHSTTLVPALLRSSSIPRPRLCSLGSITKGACSLEKFNSTSKFWGFGFSTRIAGSLVAPRSMGSVTGRQSAMFAKPRVVVKKVLSKEQPEGDGATVRRSIGRWVFSFGCYVEFE